MRRVDRGGRDGAEGSRETEGPRGRAQREPPGQNRGGWAQEKLILTITFYSKSFVYAPSRGLLKLKAFSLRLLLSFSFVSVLP